MKVLYLINYAGSGGSEKYVEELLRAFHPGRCSCGLCYNIDGPLAEKAAAMGVPVHRLEMKGPFDLGAARKLAALCRAEGYDVVHAQYPRENCVAVLSRRLGGGARVVFTSHLMIEQPLPWRLVNRALTPSDHRVIALCGEAAELLKRNGVCAGRVSVIPNGAALPEPPLRDRTAAAQLGIPDGAAVLLTLARLSPEKGVDFLIRAAARLKERTSVPFRVLVAGDGEQRSELEALIRSLGLEDTVTLLGYRSDAHRLLAAADVYVNCSRSELMSFAILEAMARALPLAATAVGGNPELVRENGRSGLLAPFGDEEAFAGILRTLLEDESLRLQLGQAGREKVRTRYSLENSLARTLEAYAPD